MYLEDALRAGRHLVVPADEHDRTQLHRLAQCAQRNHAHLTILFDTEPSADELLDLAWIGRGQVHFRILDGNAIGGLRRRVGPDLWEFLRRVRAWERRRQRARETVSRSNVPNATGESPTRTPMRFRAG